jgi:hypothetical protein
MYVGISINSASKTPHSPVGNYNKPTASFICDEFGRRFDFLHNSVPVFHLTAQKQSFRRVSEFSLDWKEMVSDYKGKL